MKATKRPPKAGKMRNEASNLRARNLLGVDVFGSPERELTKPVSQVNAGERYYPYCEQPTSGQGASSPAGRNSYEGTTVSQIHHAHLLASPLQAIPALSPFVPLSLSPFLQFPPSLRRSVTTSLPPEALA
jgi:hypothetical protein